MKWNFWLWMKLVANGTHWKKWSEWLADHLPAKGIPQWKPHISGLTSIKWTVGRTSMWRRRSTFGRAILNQLRECLRRRVTIPTSKFSTDIVDCFISGIDGDFFFKYFSESNGQQVASPRRSSAVEEVSSGERPNLDDDFNVRTLENVQSKLFAPLNAPFFTYNKVPWTLHVRKEVFITRTRISTTTTTTENDVWIVYCFISHRYSHLRRTWFIL